MIVDPTSWLLLLIICAVVAGALIANGLRLRRAEVGDDNESSLNVNQTEIDEGDHPIEGSFVPFIAAILLGGFSLVALLMIPFSFRSLILDAGMPATMFWCLAVFVLMVLLSFISLLRSETSRRK